MKFIIKVILIIGVATALQTFLPWWSIVIAALVVNCLLNTKGLSSFTAGFLAIFLLWSTKAYYIDVDNAQLLSSKIAAMFNVSPLVLILITGSIGGLVAGFTSLTCNTFLALFIASKNRKNKYYS